MSPPRKSLPDLPVIVVYLEDPPGTGLAACCGEPFRIPNGWSSIPRWLCIGCAKARPSLRFHAIP